MNAPPAHHQLDALAARAAAGDGQAFTDIIIATQLEVRLFVAARVASAELVDEVVQSTYVVAFERLSTYVGPDRLEPWLKGIAHNRLRTELRHRRRQQGMEVSDFDALLQRQRDESEPSPAVADSYAAQLDRCMDKLPPRARLLIERRYLEAQSLDMLAQQFKQSAASIAVLLHRLRSDLRRCMQSAGAGS